MKKAIFILLLFISINNVFAQSNFGFEVWDTTYNGTYSTVLNSVYGVPNPLTGKLSNWTSGSFFGVSQTTDSYSGNYSLIIHNWYNYAWEWITYRDSISYKPQYLQGYFKYNSGGVNGISNGILYITLLKSNGTSNDTIAHGNYQFDSTAFFIPFQVTLNYISALNPDSVSIYIVNANSNCILDPVCNLLYLDDLGFSNSPLATDNISKTENIVTVFPNPVSNILIVNFQNEIQSAEIKVLNVLGEIILSKQISNRANTTLDVAQLSNGIYLVQINTDKNSFTKKIIKE